MIEAGKFYLECLKKVHESILKENVLPENTIVNARVDLVCYSGHGKKAVGAFDLNDVTHSFGVDIDRDDTSGIVVDKVSVCIANIIADAIVNQMDWSETRETTQE